MSDILRARIFAIACGYPDADDLDDFRKSSAFKLACGRLSTRSPPCRAGRTHPTCGARAAGGRPKAITFDIDDTADTVHGHQQLSLFNAFHDERCFMPVHVYDTASGHCVLTILRPARRRTARRCVPRPSAPSGATDPAALAEDGHHH